MMILYSLEKTKVVINTTFGSPYSWNYEVCTAIVSHRSSWRRNKPHSSRTRTVEVLIQSPFHYYGSEQNTLFSLSLILVK